MQLGQPEALARHPLGVDAQRRGLDEQRARPRRALGLGAIAVEPDEIEQEGQATRRRARGRGELLPERRRAGQVALGQRHALERDQRRGRARVEPAGLLERGDRLGRLVEPIAQQDALLDHQVGALDVVAREALLGVEQLEQVRPQAAAVEHAADRPQVGPQRRVRRQRLAERLDRARLVGEPALVQLAELVGQRGDHRALGGGLDLPGQRLGAALVRGVADVGERALHHGGRLELGLDRGLDREHRRRDLLRGDDQRRGLAGVAVAGDRDVGSGVGVRLDDVGVEVDPDPRVAQLGRRRRTGGSNGRQIDRRDPHAGPRARAGRRRDPRRNRRDAWWRRRHRRTPAAGAQPRRHDGRRRRARPHRDRFGRDLGDIVDAQLLDVHRLEILDHLRIVVDRPRDRRLVIDRPRDRRLVVDRHRDRGLVVDRPRDRHLVAHLRRGLVLARRPFAGGQLDLVVVVVDPCGQERVDTRGKARPRARSARCRGSRGRWR